MAKTSADYYNDAAEYTKKANALEEAQEELSSQVAEIVEKFNDIGSRIAAIGAKELVDADDSLLSEMALRNKDINDAIDNTINKISADEKAAVEKIATEIENYNTLARAATDSYNAALKAEQEAAALAAASANADSSVGG